MVGRNLISKKALILVGLLWMLAGLTGCSGKETVLLETEDLVRVQGRTAEGQVEEGDSFAGLDEAPERVEESTLFVHICGEVKNPGVYELPVGSRIYEAVEEAGGFTEEAAADYVNLAYVLEDGWKIEIPAAERLAADGETEAGNGSGQMGNGAAGIQNGRTIRGSAGIPAGTPAEVIAGTAEGAAGGLSAGADDGLVDLNTATEEELMTLPGVGESRAKSIIAYREKSGGFSGIEDIMKVEGIKEGMFAKMKDKICVRGVK